MRAAGWVLTLGAAGAVAAGALAYRRHVKVVSIPRPEQMPSTFGPLASGQFYRAWVVAPAEGFDERAVSERLRVYGFEPALVARDPTDSRVWTAVSAWRDETSFVQNVEPVWVYHLESVTPPPASSPPGPATLDVGMTSTDAKAVDIALRTERDPAELEGFGQACRIDYPVASALLLGRATEVASGRGGPTSLASGVEDSPASHAISGVLARARMLSRELLGTVANPEGLATPGPARFGAELGTPILRKETVMVDVVRPIRDLYAQRQLDDLNARLLRSATARISYAGEFAKAEEEASWMLGRDEYGTPIFPLPEQLGPCESGYAYYRTNPAIVERPPNQVDGSRWQPCSTNRLGLPWLYLPRFPPAENYDSWPERLRRWVPKDWSGDATLKPVRPGLTVEESRDPANVVRNPYIFELEWNYQHEDFLRIYCSNFMTELSENGWGRYHMLRSAETGIQATPQHFGFSFTFTTRTVFDEVWELTSAIGKAIAQAVKSVAPVLSFIPGLGTALSMALTCAASLALGEDLSEIVKSTLAAALPGGQIARAAFETAAGVVEALVDGKPLDEALLAGLREAAIGAARLAGGDTAAEFAAAAFDAGVAIAGGQGLQALGFAALYRLVPGGSIAERGVRFAEAASRAAQNGTDVGELLLRELKRDLQPIGNVLSSQLGKAVDSVVESARIEKLSPASLLSLSPEDLAKRLGVPEAVARAAQAVVGLLEDGTPVVDEALLSALKPPPPITREGAIKLASYEDQRLDRYGHIEKHEIRVASGPGLPAALRDVARGVSEGDPEALRAREEIDRASRILRRQSYVQKYLRQEMAA